MKLLLIKPSFYLSSGHLFKRKKDDRIELTLPLLAALTPKNIEIEIVNERIDKINFNTDADIVGLTAMTREINRAYEIAESFKKRNITVIMGGIHVTYLPFEALKHCDAVVVGEAENIWTVVIKDFLNGDLKKIYKNNELPDLKNIPAPRFDILPPERYRLKIFPVQAIRGCPYKCEFCTITQFYGGKVRKRPIDDVLRDVNQVKERFGKSIFFVDENLMADKKYMKELFTALIPLKMKWMGQSTIQIAYDSELLDLAVASGCSFLEIGFESINSENLRAPGKQFHQVKEYIEGIKILQGRKIIIGASMILGFDRDDIKVFDNTLRFLKDCAVPILDPYILTPVPGTILRKRLEKEERIMNNDWRNYDGEGVVFHPNLMTAEGLRSNFWKMKSEFYSIKNIIKRIIHTPLQNLTVVSYINFNNWINLKTNLNHKQL